MLISQLQRKLLEAPVLAPAFEKLENGEDASIGLVGSVRPFLVASLFARQPRPMLVVVSGEEAAERFFPGLLAVERARAHVQTHHAAYMAPQPCLACEPGEEALRQRDARLLVPEGADPPVDHGGGADLADIVA